MALTIVKNCSSTFHENLNSRVNPLKVLLVYPYFLTERGKDYDVRPLPIGLHYIGATLIEAGHQVEILNLHDFSGDLKALARLFSKKEFDVLGISIFNGNRFGGLDCAKVAKELYPGVKVVFGGVGATFLWDFFLRHFPFVDFVIRGEGEKTFLELIDNLESYPTGPPDDILSQIKGLSFRARDGGLLATPDRDFIKDLDSLPDPSKYFTFQHVLSSRGCPWNCTFCGSPKFWKRRVRFHSPDYFVGQIKRLYDKGVDFFYVSDDTFTLKKERVIEICKGIVELDLDISWYAISRVNCVDEEILYWMRRAGCVQVSYGVESGSKEIRSYFNKGITDEEIKKAFKLTRRYGMMPRAYFIYGAPGDSKKTIDQSIALIKEIKPLSMVSYILDLYPGTRLYDDFKRRHKVTDDIWLQPIEDLMYFETDPKMDRERVLWMGRRLKKAFYSMLPQFIESLRFEDREELRPAYAGLLARLGLTFTHGDYAENQLITNKEQIAEFLFRRSLEYFPNHDAYLGLGLLLQKRRDFNESIKILREGHKLFPNSSDISLCMGVNYMNKGEFKEALKYLEPHKGNPQVDHFIRICHDKLEC